jgi:hypothetical protein
MTAIYYVVPDGKGGIRSGGHSPDGTLHPTVPVIVCTKEISQNFMGYTEANGVLVPPPAEYVQAQAAKKTADTALSAGITVTSTTQPLIDGVYSLSQSARNNINSIENFILKHGKFPGTASVLNYPDKLGVMHAFYEVQTFSDFATAITNYVTDLNSYAHGFIPALPESTVVIA